MHVRSFGGEVRSFSGEIRTFILQIKYKHVEESNIFSFPSGSPTDF